MDQSTLIEVRCNQCKLLFPLRVVEKHSRLCNGKGCTEWWLTLKCVHVYIHACRLLQRSWSYTSANSLYIIIIRLYAWMYYTIRRINIAKCMHGAYNYTCGEVFMHALKMLWIVFCIGHLHLYSKTVTVMTLLNFLLLVYYFCAHACMHYNLYTLYIYTWFHACIAYADIPKSEKTVSILDFLPTSKSNIKKDKKCKISEGKHGIAHYNNKFIHILYSSRS